MKYYFLINPIAGTTDKKELESYINDVCSKGNYEYEIYYTKDTDDATRFTKECVGEDCCVFACGGDGTVYDVVNGAVNSDVSVGVYPCGSGNDFSRIFNDPKNLEKILSRNPRKVDTINVNGNYSINVVNIGFDSKVNYDVDKYKKKFKVSTAYNIAIVTNLLKRINYPYTIKVDGEVLENGKFLLMSLGNASYYGGGYKCAPNAQIDDGLIEFCAVRKVSRFTLAKLIKIYKKGEHLENKKFAKYILYKRCKTVEIESDYEFKYTLDGETFQTKKLVASINPGSINLVCDDWNKK